MADYAERAEGIEMESFGSAPLQLGSQVSRHDFGRAQGKLSGRGTRLPRLCVGYRGAISERPHAEVTWDCQIRNHLKRATFVFFHLEKLNDGAWRGSSGPDESFGRNLAVVENHDARLCVDQARIESKLHSTRCHLLLRVVGQRRTQFREDAVSRVHKHDADFMRTEIWIVG